MPGQAALPGFDEPPPLPYDGEPRQRHTLFFALRPDKSAIVALAARRDAICASHCLRGTEVDDDRLHITLYYIGEGFGALPPAMIEGARSAAAGIGTEAFEVVLDGFTTFEIGQKRLPLVLLASETANPALMLFRQRLAAAMHAIGLLSPAGRGFTPHVTLLYGDGRVAQEPVEPVRWTVRELVLIESLPGQKIHRTLGSWPVGGKV